MSIDKKLQEQIDYWRKSGKENLDAAQVLFTSKHYDSALFFGHLTLEKMLKGLTVIATKKPALYIHDLEKLALIANLEFDEDRAIYLRSISDFNIAGRYKEIKFDFYKKCDKKYTEKHLKIIKELFLWLEKEYPKK
ncbi:MAG: HEPN domain-containing protein [Patescibacteria group bacterium]|nr:HEPN domain-containing protein [Patescibacteria group bacterium]